MFKRVVLEEWVLFLPFIGFFLVFGVFALITFCALRIARGRTEYLAALPLDDLPPAAGHDPTRHQNPN